MTDFILKIKDSLIEAVASKFDRFIQVSPYILGGIAIFVVGFIIAELASRLVLAASHKLRLEAIAEHLGLKHFLQHTKSKTTPSELVAASLKAYLIFLFFIEASRVAGLTQVTDFSTKVIDYVPDVIIALFIMLVGIRFANFMQIVIVTSLEFVKSNISHVLGVTAKYTVMVFAVLAALSQLSIAPDLVKIMFIGFISMFVLAGGLAFGLGGKDVVKELLEAIKKLEIKEIRHDHKIEEM